MWSSHDEIEKDWNIQEKNTCCEMKKTAAISSKKWYSIHSWAFAKKNAAISFENVYRFKRFKKDLQTLFEENTP